MVILKPCRDCKVILLLIRLRCTSDRYTRSREHDSDLVAKRLSKVGWLQYFGLPYLVIVIVVVVSLYCIKSVGHTGDPLIYMKIRVLLRNRRWAFFLIPSGKPRTLASLLGLGRRLIDAQDRITTQHNYKRD